MKPILNPPRRTHEELRSIPRGLKPPPAEVVFGSEAHRKRLEKKVWEFHAGINPTYLPPDPPQPALTRRDLNLFTAGFALGVVLMTFALCLWTYLL